MPFSTTVIPSTTNVDGTTIKKNVDNQIYVATEGGIRKDLAQNELRLLVLENLESVSGATDNFAESFTDEDGTYNKVNTADTTSIFRGQLYTNNNDYFFDKTVYEDTHQTSYKLLNDFDTDGKIEKITCFQKSAHPAIQYKCYFQVIFTYFDDTTETVTTDYTYGDTYQEKTVTNPFPDKTLKNVETYHKQADTGTTIYTKDIYFDYISQNLSNKQISLNYDKGNPDNFFVLCIDGNGDIDRTGDIKAELKNSTETSGEVNCFENNNINFTSVPDELIVYQKNTSSSFIKYIVCFIEETM